MKKIFLIALCLSGLSIQTQTYAVNQEKGASIGSSLKKGEIKRIVWGAKISPFVQRVLVVLEEKISPIRSRKRFLPFY